MASNKSGVFTLVDVGERQETGSWDTASNVWMIGPPVIVGKGKATNYAYAVGGLGVSVYQRIEYANDTATAPSRAKTTNPCGYSMSVGNLTAAYSWVSEGQGGNSSIIERYDYYNDTANSIPITNIENRNYLGGVAGNLNYAYFVAGRNPAVSPSETSTSQRIDYANDTTAAAVRGPTVNDVLQLAASSNPQYGYWIGGHPGDYSTVARVDFSNDNVDASPRGPLTEGARHLAGNSAAANALSEEIQNETLSTGVDKVPVGTGYGYFVGGNDPGDRSIVQRVDYANDTATASEKGPLQNGGASTAAAGNTSYGYVAGGNRPSTSTIISRIDYNNDTAVAPNRGALNKGRVSLGGVGNNDYGYFGGGEPGPGNS